MSELEQAIASIKNQDLAMALRVFSMVMSSQHEENTRNLKDLKESHLSAFPGGDTHGHRAAHEALIKRELAAAAFYDRMKEKLATAGLMGAGGITLTALLAYGLKVIAEHIPK